MAVDRGELRYLIRVEDKFTNPIRKFREELLKAKNTMEFVRNTSSGFSTVRAEAQEATKAVRTFGKVRLKEISEEEQQARIRKELAKEGSRVRKEAEREAKAQAAAQAKAARESVAAARAVERAKKAEAAAQRASEVAARRHAAEIRALNGTYKKTGDTVNRVAFTFRRLFGILAAFTIARELASGFGSLVRESIRFNQTLEDSQIGLAGVFSAAGEVRDAQDEVTKGAEAFAIAQKEAVRQQGLLRLESLRTTATFEQLLETFQVATGPGLEAGLNLDQIRQLSVRVSQAAAALGIAQNQLSEEIRSLLTGTGTQRTSRIFAVLFGSNEEIRRARESGTLFQLLSSRLEAFGTAAAATEQTFTGLNQRLRESVTVASGIAAGDLFNSLKQSISDVADLFVEVQRNAAGAIIAIEPRATTVALLKQVFDFMDGIVKVLREAASTVAFEDLSKALADVLSVLQAVFVGGGAFVVGFAQGLRDVVSVLATMAALVKDIAPLLALYIRMRVVLAAINGIAGKTVSALLSWGPAAKVAAEQMTAAEAKAASIKRLTTGITVGLGAAALAATPLLSSLFDVNLTIGQTVRLIGLSLTNAIESAIGVFQRFANSLQGVFGILNKDIREQKGILTTTADAVETYWNAWRAAALQIIGADEAAKRALDENTRKILEDDKLLENLGKDRANKVAAEEKRLQEERKKREEQFAKDIGAILAEGAAGEGLQQKLDARVQQVKDILKSITDAANQESGGSIGARPTPITEDDRAKLDQKNAQLALLRAELVLEEKIGAAERARLAPTAQAAILAQATAQQLEQQLEILRIQNGLELTKLQQETAQVRGAEAIAFAQQKINNLKAAQAAEEEEIRLKIEAQKRALQEAQLVAFGSVGDGLSRGLENIAADFTSSFVAGVEIMQNAFQSFASFAADAMVSIFDPTADQDLTEKFARFLQDLARQILTTILQLLIATALAKAFGVPLPSDTTPPPALPGFAEGGEIPGSKKAPIARPRGLDPRDTQPIWAQPGEFMQRLSAVKKYGVDVMEALNKGAIDPLALRELAGLSKARKARAAMHKKIGFATGGQITPTAARETVREAGAEAEAGVPPIALVVGNEQSLDRLLAGGRKSMLSFIKDNAPAIEGHLSKHRR